MNADTDRTPAPRRLFKIPRWMSVAVAFAFMGAAAVIIWSELRENNPAEILLALQAIAPFPVVAAVGLVVLSYGCLIGCERIALSILGRRDIPMTRIARATFTAYALGNAVGFSYATVPAARAQLFKNDLNAAEIAGLSAITGAAVMIAGSAVAGLGLLVAGREIAAATVGEAWMWRLLGAALMTPACVWIAVAGGVLPNSWIERLRLEPPSFRMAAAQVGMGMADWAAAAAVLYILLPDNGGWSYPAFMTVFLAAAVLGSASGAPAGIGVFEASILALSPHAPHAPGMAAGLIVYRLVWTVAPLIVGAALLAYDTIVRKPQLRTP
jgi:uncharacterized membrane protein YbhN (UPF0104 family)